ncbi:hypothetical protein [Hellea balneolensis]|uniref:hypothetical protein n=1 Tax=Hellea balneolensis TaxID=287478 RepID=UPI00040A638C|nr:hypothetical protein [Hellea balneolensis]
MPPLSDIIKGAVILFGAALVIWMFFIRPHSYDWQAAGQVEGQVKTLMSNSKVIGRPVINAVVTLENGHQTIIAVPLKSDVRQGDMVLLRVQEDAESSARRRYKFYKEVD